MNERQRKHMDEFNRALDGMAARSVTDREWEVSLTQALFALANISLSSAEHDRRFPGVGATDEAGVVRVDASPDEGMRREAEEWAKPYAGPLNFKPYDVAVAAYLAGHAAGARRRPAEPQAASLDDMGESLLYVGYQQCLSQFRKGVEVDWSEDADIDADNPLTPEEDKPLGTVMYYEDSGDPSVGMSGYSGFAFVPREGLVLVKADELAKLAQPTPPPATHELRVAAERALNFIESLRVPQTLANAATQVWQASGIINALRTALAASTATDIESRLRNAEANEERLIIERDEWKAKALAASTATQGVTIRPETAEAIRTLVAGAVPSRGLDDVSHNAWHRALGIVQNDPALTPAAEVK